MDEKSDVAKVAKNNQMAMYYTTFLIIIPSNGRFFHK